MKLNLLLLSAAALVSAATAIDLGEAGNYVILTKTGISTVPASDITGKIGVSPIAATAITGFGLTMHSGGQHSTASQITGTAVAADYGGPAASELTTAVSDMLAAYNEAAASEATASFTTTEPGVIGGSTLSTGVYSFGTGISFDSDITFDGGSTDGSLSTDVFIVQTTGSVSQAKGTRVNLSGGAQAKNIFWQVAGRVEVGAGAHMVGVLLVKEDALFKTGSSLDGRVLAETRCDLDHSVITQPTA
jgi:hypothetical protein